MRVLLIIPAYNEEKNIRSLIVDIRQTVPDFDFVIINDASKDNTKAVCESLNAKIISLPVNLGIGGAVQTGFMYARENGYDIAIQVDGDGQHDPAHLEQLISPIITEYADVSIGSRFIDKYGFQSTFMRRVGIKFFRILVRLLTGIDITDCTSGFRAYNKCAIQCLAKCYSQDYPEPESIITLCNHGFKIVEVPVEMKERLAGVSSINTLRSIYYMIKVSLAILIAKIKPRMD